MTPSQPLWHFTCADHGAPGIGRRGLLLPRAHPLLPELTPLVWLTNDPLPDRFDVGLTSMILTCDRMGCRYRVTDRGDCFRWWAIRRAVDPKAVEVLEFGRLPLTWWVSAEPVPVVAA